MSLTSQPSSPPQAHPTGERRAELERIRDALWPPSESADARKARIARNLAALDQLRSLPKIELTAEQWKIIDQASVLDEDEE